MEFRAAASIFDEISIIAEIPKVTNVSHFGPMGPMTPILYDPKILKPIFGASKVHAQSWHAPILNRLNPWDLGKIVIARNECVDFEL